MISMFYFKFFCMSFNNYWILYLLLIGRKIIDKNYAEKVNPRSFSWSYNSSTSIILCKSNLNETSYD